MSDPNGYQPQGGDQQNNGVSGAAQAPQYTQPAQNYAAPQYTQSQGGYNGQYQDLRPATGRVPDLPSAQQVCGGGARAVLRHLRPA